MTTSPVFFRELRSASRGILPFAVRVIYVAFILGTVWFFAYGRWTAAGAISPRGFASLARNIFLTIATAQAAAVLTITPALVAGTMARERASGTLEHLLVTPLSAWQIVTGKLAARLGQVLGFLALGFPVLSLLSLLGGIDPMGEILPIELATASAALFLAGLSIFVSALAREPREAVFASYGLGAVWLTLPLLLRATLGNWSPGVSVAIRPALDAIAGTDPLIVLQRSTGPPALGTVSLAIAGLVLAMLAIPFVRIGGRPEGASSPIWRRRLGRRIPPCGDDPMRWKEARFGTRGGLVGFIVRGLVALLVLGFAAEAARLVAASVPLPGRGGWSPMHRSILNEHLRTACTIVYVLALIGTAVSAATSITAERERGTWTDLLASPLEGPEILAAKRAGALRRVRPLVLAFFAIALIGVIPGAVHPLGLLFAAVGMASYLLCAAALGVVVSLHSRTTTSALLLTMGVLFVCHGGYLFCCAVVPIKSEIVAAGCSPALIALSLVSMDDVRSLLESGSSLSLHNRGGTMLIAGMFSVIAYGIGTMACIVVGEASFDAAVPRPARFRDPSSRGADSTRERLSLRGDPGDPRHEP